MTASRSIRCGSRPFGPLQRRSHQLAEQRVGPIGPALELGVGLGRHPVRVVLELDELDQPPVRRDARADAGRRPRAAAVAVVELEAVPVPLGHGQRPVGLGHLGAGQQHGLVGAEPHRPALVRHLRLVGHEVDHHVRREAVELARVGPLQPGPVAGHLDDHHVQSEAQARGRGCRGRGCSRRPPPCPRSHARRSRPG